MRQLSRPRRDLDAEIAQAEGFLAAINAEIATVMAAMKKRRRGRQWVTHPSGEVEYMLVALPPPLGLGSLKDRRDRMEQLREVRRVQSVRDAAGKKGPTPCPALDNQASARVAPPISTPPSIHASLSDRRTRNP